MDRNGLDELAGVFLGEIEPQEEKNEAAEPEVAEPESVEAESDEVSGELPDGDDDDIASLAEVGEGDETDGDEVDGAASEDQPKKYTVKVDGEILEVDEAELKSGYSRMQDYTRKTTKLAEERKAFDAEKSELQREREVYANILDNWESGLETALKELMPDMDELRDYDPAEYIKAKEKLDKYKATLDNIKQEKQRLIGEEEAKRKEQFEQYVKAESEKLFTQVPEWKDEAVRRAEVQKVANYAKETFGFSDSDINNTYSHALWVAMRESMKYRQIVEKRKQLKPEVKKKVADPGSASQPTSKVKRVEKAAQSLKKTGSVQDYARMLLEDMQN